MSLHWGAEGVHEPTGYQRQVAERLTQPGRIDLIVGHHAHVGARGLSVSCTPSWPAPT